MREVRYANKRVERLCTDRSRMVREIGAELAKALRLRVAELRAAAVMADVLAGPGRWEALTGDRVGIWSAHVSANWRLVVRADGPDADCATVLGLEDYH